ncbi:response regulator [Brevundimonas lenta]|uniref:Sensory/regulatory protein RpfC n=1 Tax=Brevundimonas lenta TaxID=424796 RepID=A0A7W6JG95_9CAUL|nr:response regulator [Brevundimonas lenta]MBB4083532.1 signal transduction histidine kinase/CheY-like chemotaxis protein [Brevundimonas lenta]
MDRILYCFAFQHDWRWTVAAALICVFGVAVACHLLGKARGMTGARQRNVAMLAAFTGGLAVFSTHFLAMQGYDAGAPIRYGVWLTISSFFMAFASIALACMVVLARPGWLNRALGAALGLAGVAAMHFLGVAALEMPGLITWQPVFVAGGVLAGIGIAAGGAAFLYGPGRLRLSATAASGAISIVVLHFVSMSAMTIGPEGATVDGWTVSAGAMGAVIAAMVVSMITIAAAVIWMDRSRRSSILAQIRDALDAMPDGMAFYDAEDRLVLWNNRYAEVNPELSSNLQSGMTFRQIIQIGLDEGLYAEAVGREEEWVRERLATRAERATTMEQHIAGDRWLRVSDRKTRAGGIVTVCTDITELKHDARALGEARDAAQAANSAKSQFLANMSHEIRTPLNGVIGVAQALANTELNATQREMLDLIRSSGQTLQVLLSDILDLARVESGRMELSEEAFDLGRAVREAATLYEASAQEKGLQFFVEIAPEVDRWIQGDVVRLKQILTNLVSNAVKFTSSGFVCLTAAPGPTIKGVQTLRFSIEDTGIGFDSETRIRLFSRFEQADGAITRKFGGSGLGLAISRQLAEMMSGELDCESEPGGGSSFMLTIPLRLAEAPVALAVSEEAAPGVDERRMRVLLADDHPVNRKVVEMILAQADIDLTSVEDGAQALQAVRDGDYDLVLMDMQMPVMDGLTATREIRLHEVAMGLSRLPIVMLTANALPEHIAAAEGAGADRHLAKPFDAAELLELVVTLPRARAASIAA